MGNRLAGSIHRWRTARRMTLSAIVLAGGMATVCAATYRLAAVQDVQFDRHHVTTGYTYSGIGVELEERGSQFIVRRVFANTPADGKIFPGARLLSADGEQPESMAGWTALIRGEAGEPVSLEVSYGCPDPEKVELERTLIHLRY